MGINSSTTLNNEWENTLEYISKINFYLNNYRNEVKDLCQDQKKLIEEIQRFIVNYSNYEELERFSIALIGYSTP